MKRACVLGLATCLLAVLALPAQAILLRYSPKVGVATKHKFTTAGRTEIAAEAMTEPMRMEMEMVMHSLRKALSETSDTVKVETRSFDSSLKITMLGQTQTEALPETRCVTQMDRRARILKVEEADARELGDVQQMIPGGPGTWGNWDSFPPFAEKDVKAGDKWSEELSLVSLTGMQGMTVKATSEMIALTTFQARKCAKIRTVFEVPLNPNLLQMGGLGEEAAEGLAEGMIKGMVLWYYDYENSVYAYAEGTTETSTTMDMGEAMGGLSAIKVVINMKMTLAK